jgi:hypothetical protein
MITSIGLAELVFRIWGVMLMAQVAMMVPAVLNLLAGQAGPEIEASFLFQSRVSVVASVLIEAGLALFVFFRARLLAQWTTREESGIAVAVAASTLFALAVAVFGLTLMVDGTTELGVTLYVWWSVWFQGIEPASMVFENRTESVVRAAIELSIGTALFVGHDAIGRGWSSLRGMGR